MHFCNTTEISITKNLRKTASLFSTINESKNKKSQNQDQDQKNQKIKIKKLHPFFQRANR